MFLFALFILGICIGSFLNVCIWRLPRHESISEPPSHCPTCNTRLKPLDLIPLFSQLFLRGRCRYCKTQISWRYFGVELCTGVLFVLAGAQPALANVWPASIWQNGIAADPALHLLRDLIIICTLTVIFWVDYDTRLIQLESVFLLGVAGAAYLLWQFWQAPAEVLWMGIPSGLLAMVVCAAVLWIVRLIFSVIYGQEAMGFGDVMLIAAIAINLGWNATLWTFVFLSVVGGALVGIMLQIPRAVQAYRWARREVRFSPKRATLAWPLARHAFRKGIPFGPMLAVGAIIALFYGVPINKRYVEWLQTPQSVVRR
jgi:leader peptidase (prepilin peptidase)/N-methyltransferase